MTQLAKIENPNVNQNEDSQSDTNGNMFFYEITSTSPNTASVVGINLEYIFSNAFGNNNTDEWPSIEASVATGSNSEYITALQPYVSNLVVPGTVKLNENGKYDQNGETYNITQVTTLLYPNRILADGGHERVVWGTGEEMGGRGYLWGNPDLDMNITFSEGIADVAVTSDSWFDPYPYCAALKSVTFPSSLKKISWNAFQNCTSFSSFTIPDSVEIVETEAFAGCTNLVTITGPVGVGNYGDSYGLWPECLTTYIGTSGNEVWGYEFAGCRNLTNITIPSTVTRIRDDAFADCSDLTSITLPSTITEIGDYAFYCCSALTSIIIPKNVEEVGSDILSGCDNLTSITIPTSIDNDIMSLGIDYSILNNINYEGSESHWCDVMEIGDYGQDRLEEWKEQYNFSGTIHFGYHYN